MAAIAKTRLDPETVVRLKEELIGVQGSDGNLLTKDQADVGTVRELSDRGDVLVHWLPADLDAWTELEELKPMGDATRLVAVFDVDGEQTRTLDRYKTVTTEGLTHNWTVEHWPGNLVRAIRSDDWAWTFDWYPAYERVFPIRTFGTDPPTDDDAEALTAAELSFT